MSETSKWQLFLILILVGIAGYFAYPSDDKPLFGPGELFEGKKIQLGLDLQGGSELRLALKKEGIAESNISEFTEKAKEIIERRINLHGLKEPRIQKYGDKQILIQLPGMDVSEVERVKKIITSSGKLEFKLEADPKIVADYKDRFPKAPPGYLWYEREDLRSGRGEEQVLVRDKAELTGEHIVRAGTTFQGIEGLAVSFKLNPHGTRIFADVTKKYARTEVGEDARRLAIILDNKLVSAPAINTPIPDGEGIITGRFTLQEAQDLATVLRSGSLPASLEIIGESYVGPSLGEDAIRRGIVSFILAVGAVALFMLVYYHLSGLIAIIAMAMNFILLAGILSFFSATLTLPGIAALVLTLGMAVDANIIFYERIREEKNKGKDTFAAFESGFNRALVTVFDANLTTLLAGIILYYFGIGPLKGFAVVLCIGIITTLFTGYFASRVMLRASIESGMLKSFSMLKIFTKANFGFMAKAPLFKILSLIAVLLSITLFFSKGKESYGIDFTGGTVLNIDFTSPMNIAEVRNKIRGITVIDPKTNISTAKYPDAEIQSVLSHIKGDMKSSFKEVLKEAQYSATEFQIRTKFVATEEQVKGLKGDLIRTFEGRIATDQVLSTTTISKVKDYRYRMTLALPENADLKQIQEKLKNRCTKEGFSEPFIVEQERQSSTPTAITQVKVYDLYFKEDDEISLEKIVREELGLSAGPFSRVEVIGGVVAREIQRNAVIAIFLSWFGMIIYLAIRFEFKFGLAAVIAIIHDVLISLGCVILFNMLVPKSSGIGLEINLSSVAAFLTIIGYSVNDTIVVFDRIRENIKLLKGEPLLKIINRSINETLSRTIWTSLTVFLTVTILFTITARSGGGIPSFAFPMIIGSIIGAYSSIFIASALLGGKEKDEKVNPDIRSQ
ncbi:MAG: protein translocase subunit SecD [Planctomycetota bacterium]|nr:protein translocase subunit SecD [Planctomycetota bacterium]MDI6788118.1 protein translocase subunit SecD [Planctomycetota bacterium]